MFPNDVFLVFRFSGYAVNFQTGKSNGIIFHFNPRAPESAVILNTSITTDNWGTELRIVDSRVKDIYFSRVEPFELKLKIISDDTFHVYVNNSLKTEYQCQGGMKITATKYICFTSCITIDR